MRCALPFPPGRRCRRRPPEKTDQRRKGQSLKDERGENDAEGEELHQMRAGETGVDVQARAAASETTPRMPRPADDEDLAPIGKRSVSRTWLLRRCGR